MSNKNYPLVGDYKRKPKKDIDGAHNVGKPCIVCSKFTVGTKWIQVSYMRGDDELVRVCGDHWKGSNVEIIAAYEALLERVALQGDTTNPPEKAK